MFKITFLGAGTILPNPYFKLKQSYSAIMVELNNQKLLFDIGPGTLTKMHNMKINTQIFPDYLFLTHFHIDHTLDYIALVKSRCLDENTGKIKNGKKINVFAPKGLKRWNKEIFENIFHWSYMNKQLHYKKVVNLNERTGGLVIKRNWKITCCEVLHDNSLAYRLECDGKSFVYSGDMAYDERICNLGKNADLVAIECSFPDKRSLKGNHLDPEKIAKLADAGNFKKIILTHMYPLTINQKDKIIKTIKKISNCDVAIAYDYKSVRL